VRLHLARNIVKECRIALGSQNTMNGIDGNGIGLQRVKKA
jgi:hypothetical protein